MANINWTPPDGWTAKTGARVQFLAPCDCSEADGLIINETQYNFLTVAGVAVNAAGGAFASGALIELVLNCDITPPVAYLVSSAGGGQGGAYVQADEPDSDTLGTLWYDTDEEDADPDALQEHINDKENPHQVTAAQVGADASGSAAQALTDAKAYTDREKAKYLPLAGGTMTGVLSHSADLKIQPVAGIVRFGTNSDMNQMAVLAGMGSTWFLRPGLSNKSDLGTSSTLWKNLYLSGVLSDGTNSIAVANIANKNDIATTKYAAASSSSHSIFKINGFGDWGTGAWYQKGFSMLITSRAGETVWLTLAANDSNTAARAIRLMNTYSKILKIYYSVSESAIYVTAAAWCNNVSAHIISNLYGDYVPTVAKASALASDVVEISITEMGPSGSGSSVTTKLGSASVPINLLGSAERPQYNSADLALYSDIPAIPDIPDMSGYLPLAGGTMTGELRVNGKDVAGGSKIVLESGSGQITNSDTLTLLGFLDSSRIAVGHSSYVLVIRGSATRPAYNGKDLALYSDLSSYLPLSGGTLSGALTVSDKIAQGSPSSDSTLTEMNRFKNDLFVEGSGAAPNIPQVAGFYLGKSTSDENRHMDIVSGATYSYIDFNKAGSNEDYDVRLLVNVENGDTVFRWGFGEHLTSKIFNVLGTIQQNGSPVALKTDLPSTESWTFTLEDGSTVIKAVCVG